MKSSLHLKKRMLEIERLNYQRQCCSLVALIISTCIFILLTFAQCGLLAWLGKNKSNFWLTIDFIAVMTALLSFTCGLVLIFLVEREKGKIRKKIADEARAFGFKSRIEEEKENKEFFDKCSDFCEDISLKMDFFGTSCNFSMQLASLIFLLANGMALGEMYKLGPSNMPLGQVIDLVSNAAFFLAALLLTISHVIMSRKDSTSSKNTGKMSKMMSLMFIGSSMIFGGKIVCALEAVGIVSPLLLNNGYSLPVGWLTRTVGIIMLAVSVWLVIKKTSEKCDALAKIVEHGEDAREVLSMVTTQDVRSCFGYMEYGTR